MNVSSLVKSQIGQTLIPYVRQYPFIHAPDSHCWWTIAGNYSKFSMRGNFGAARFFLVVNGGVMSMSNCTAAETADANGHFSCFEYGLILPPSTQSITEVQQLAVISTSSSFREPRIIPEAQPPLPPPRSCNSDDHRSDEVSDICSAFVKVELTRVDRQKQAL